MTGTIKTFRDHWGFIQSDQYPGDIYVSARAADAPLQAGDMVEFDIDTKPGNHNGARAANVKKLGGGGGHAYAPPLMQAHAFAPQAPGRKVSGTMVSVKDTWGFVKTASVQGDVFLGMRDNAQLSVLPAVGDELSFELVLDPKSGRYKAVSVAPSLKGIRLQGTVTQVRDGGWGFATSEGVEGEVMLGKRNLSASGIEMIHQGDLLEYELNVAAKGYEALNIQMVAAH